MQIPVFVQTAGLLVLSNVFMTFAWYGHLKNMNSRAWYIAALVSWGIALFEYRQYIQVERKWTRVFSSESSTWDFLFVHRNWLRDGRSQSTLSIFDYARSAWLVETPL